MASEKYLWIEGVFLAESHITLDDVDMSLASAQPKQATSTYVLFVLKKKKEKVFFLFSVPRHAPNYPALIMCMPLTIRV